MNRVASQQSLIDKRMEKARKSGKWRARYNHERGSWEVQTPLDMITDLTEPPFLDRRGPAGLEEAA